MKKHFKITVRGKVQGVGFRFSCMEEAYKHDVKGFVRNRSDRSVYIEAEGEETALNAFREWCTKGPVWARVSQVEEEEGEMQNFSSFEIAR